MYQNFNGRENTVAECTHTKSSRPQQAEVRNDTCEGEPNLNHCENTKHKPPSNTTENSQKRNREDERLDATGIMAEAQIHAESKSRMIIKKKTRPQTSSRKNIEMHVDVDGVNDARSSIAEVHVL